MNDIDYNKDYYSTLGVSKDASADEIKSAFRKLSMKYHPDRQQGKTEQEKKESTEKFQEINDAYEVVGNKDKRAEYDQIREMGGRRMGGMGGFGFGHGDDLMREFMRRNGFGDMSGFGNHGGFSNEHFRKAHRQRNPIDGQDIHINVNLSFEDFFFGCTKTLDIKVKNKCSHCKNGLTGDTPEYTTCPSCRGTGMRTTRQGNMIMQETCQNCGGTGEILKNRCTHCNGTTEDGIRVQSCVLEIPKFSYSGFTKSFGKVGHCGRFGGSAGDITVTAYMNDNGRFVLNSDYDCETLRTVHFVPVLKALIGGKEKILTPYGYVEVDIPRCMENPTEITVPKKGLKKKNSNENADLIVVLQWDIPKSVNDKEKELIQKVLKSMGGRDGTFESVEKLNEFDKEYVKRINETFTSNIS